jgi:drug/metabolite transporter (DMT)-like permease
MNSIRNIPLALATSIMMTYPVFTFVISSQMKTEIIKNYQIAGLVFTLLGATFLIYRSKTAE